MTDDQLVLGPLLRHVDERSATLWMETAGAATVTVTAGERRWEGRTFRVHGHHYALVACEGLEPGTRTPYAVSIDGTLVWPRPGGLDGVALPDPVLTTLAPDRPPSLVFGSCRTSVGHDEEGNRTHGVDALRAYALALALGPAAAVRLPWPDLVLFLGDQVYADETTKEMRAFIESRRDIGEPPGEELKDYEEYAHLYRLAWGDPVNRWLLSTVPTAMIFDDHDIRDDWNTSSQWRRAMEATSWWHDRIVGGLASYWVYQHLGNLAPAERAEDEMWRLVAEHDGPGEPDLTEALDRFAERVDQQPSTYRWSFSREIGGSRLVVVDSRAARVLEDGNRSIVDDRTLGWLDEQLRGGVDHLFVGTSLPFLLPPGLHNLEAFSEALAGGGWGRAGRALGERLRQAGDLEHWAAFQRGFQEVAELAVEVATGRRGTPPRTVTFLSGDVHHSYVSRVTGVNGAPILQAVCSPIRNPLPRVFRFATAALSYGIAGPMGLVAARSAKVPDAPFTWERVRGPWFDNNLATLDVTTDGLDLRWLRGAVEGERHDRPRIAQVAHVQLRGDRVSAEPPPAIPRVSRLAQRLRPSRS